jgi:hypothetical protein
LQLKNSSKFQWVTLSSMSAESHYSG